MIVDDIRDLLPLYALGALSPDEMEAVDRAVASNPALAGELASFQEVAETFVAPVPPADHVFARLQASIGAGPLERYSSRMARLFDVTVDRAREILALVNRPASWETPIPGLGLGLVHFDGGPACATADCGFVRLDKGVVFPPHVHRGEETVLVLVGQLRDGDRVYGPGDEIVESAFGPEHVVRNEGDEPVIYAARVYDGIEIGGQRVK